MAHTLGLKTIAEGIETERQLEILRSIKCDMVQGYYLSRPMPAGDIERMLPRISPKTAKSFNKK